MRLQLRVKLRARFCGEDIYFCFLEGIFSLEYLCPELTIRKLDIADVKLAEISRNIVGIIT